MGHPNLTERAIEDALAKAADDAELRLFDGKLPGLVLWRRPRGVPRWYAFRRVAGRKVRVPIAEPSAYPALRLEQARALYPAVLTQLAAGEDLAKARRERRLAAAAEREAARQARAGGKVPLADVLTWVKQRMDEKGRQERHTAERQRIGKALIADGLRDLCDPRACAIAEAWINKQECSALTKHRYGQHVRAIGRAALRKYDTLPRDPFRNLEVGSPTIPPPAMFTLPELVKLASDEAVATEWGRLFYFLLATGCRYREGAFARWSRIDLDAATFAVLPPTAEEREAGEALKRNKARTVHLHPELVKVLRRWSKDRQHGEFLFHDLARKQSGDTTKAFRAHLDRLGIAVQERHVHTLRHCHVALSVACGVSDLQLRLSVGHGGPAMTAHYASAAMLWRGKLREWHGTFRLRDPAEAKRLSGAA